MDCTDYVLAILAGNPTVVHVDLQAGYVVEEARIPPDVMVTSWGHDWSEGIDAEGRLVVRFRA